MPNAFDVINCGTDTSGRTIWMTRFMSQWFETVLADPLVKPFADKVVIVQGAWMERNGGGADASAGYHDKAMCIDFRTWNLSTVELDAFVRACRRHGGAAWRRDADHGGMDDHCHVTLGGDKPGTAGAHDSWQQYVNGDNGLTGAAHGPDYEWRPDPLVTFHYNAAPPEDDMPTPKDLLDAHVPGTKKSVAEVLAIIPDLQRQVGNAGERERKVLKAVSDVADQLVEVGNAAKDDATKAQVRGVRERLLKEVQKLTEETP